MKPAKENDNQKLLKLMEVNELYKFEGKFSNMGIKKAYEGKRGSYDERSFYKPYILLKNVSCRGIVVADELYLSYSKSFRKLGELYVGDVVSFNGKVTSYFKKNGNDVTIDYGIGWPNRCVLLNDDHTHERKSLLYDDDDFMEYIENQDNSFFLDRRNNKNN